VRAACVVEGPRQYFSLTPLDEAQPTNPERKRSALPNPARLVFASRPATYSSGQNLRLENRREMVCGGLASIKIADPSASDPDGRPYSLSFIVEFARLIGSKKSTHTVIIKDQPFHTYLPQEQ
jgi:hypothetical protein